RAVRRGCLGGASVGGGGGMPRIAGRPASGTTTAPQTVAAFARAAQNKPGDLETNRAKLEDAKQHMLAGQAKDGAMKGNMYFEALKEAGEKKRVYDEARLYLLRRDQDKVQGGQLGVDLS